MTDAELIAYLQDDTKPNGLRHFAAYDREPELLIMVELLLDRVKRKVPECYEEARRILIRKVTYLEDSLSSDFVEVGPPTPSAPAVSVSPDQVNVVEKEKKWWQLMADRLFFSH